MAYLVAEIGQNHNGVLGNVFDLIRICADPRREDFYGPSVGGVDAVKLTKRALGHELAREAAERPYGGENSFGATYGEHRAALELSDEEHAEAFRYAKSLGLDFIETICAPEALSLLDHFTPDALKVASRDLTNHRLIEALADTGIPLILSTGMADAKDLGDAVRIVERRHFDLTILHCLSQYPAEPKNLNLHTIGWLKDHYPYRIGYSDHTVGVWAPVAAVAMGAEVVEKHVTLSRQMRGSDHEGSLERDGIHRWVRDTRRLVRALGRRQIERSGAALEAHEKLARSVATKRPVTAGERLTEADIQPLSPGDGIPWPERDRLVGRWMVHGLGEAETLSATMVHG